MTSGERGCRRREARRACRERHGSRATTDVVLDMGAYASTNMDATTVVKSVGERMKRSRERAGLSQGHVAMRMGSEIDQPRISKWESGAAQPSLVQLFR